MLNERVVESQQQPLEAQGAPLSMSSKMIRLS